MRHRSNVAAFDEAMVAGAPLAGVYGGMVKLEISLRDNPGPWTRGHEFFSLIPATDPGLTSLVDRLRTQLVSVPCSAKDGSLTTVRADQYPDIRYAVFQSDEPTSTLTDSQLEDIRTTLKEIFMNPTIRGLLA